MEPKVALDRVDSELITLLWKEFPLDPHPYREMAKALSLKEEEVLRRISSLMEKGLVKRIGAIVDPSKVGFVSTLVALKVPDDSLSSVVRFINSNPGVTHNYQRNHEYNVWFAMIVPGRKHIEEMLKELETRFGLEAKELPRSVRYKIGVKLDLK